MRSSSSILQSAGGLRQPHGCSLSHTYEATGKRALPSTNQKVARCLDVALVGNQSMKYANVIKGKYSKEAEVASVAAFEAGRIAMEGLLEAKSRSGDHNNNNTLGVTQKGALIWLLNMTKPVKVIFLSRYENLFPV